MNAIQRLEKYIAEHPDCWEYENELQEVNRLKAMVSKEPLKSNKASQLAEC